MSISSLPSQGDLQDPEVQNTPGAGRSPCSIISFLSNFYSYILIIIPRIGATSQCGPLFSLEHEDDNFQQYPVHRSIKIMRICKGYNGLSTNQV